MDKEVYAVLKQKRTLFDNRDMESIIRKLQSQIYDEVLDFYGTQFGRLEGKTYIQKSTALAKAINGLSTDISKFISGNKQYNDVLKGYFVKFDQVEQLNKDLHKAMSDVNVSSLVKAAGPQKKQLIEQITTNMTSQGVDVNFVQPLKKTLYNNLLLGVPQSDAKQWMRNYIAGQGETLGQLERYAGQVTRDALNQYDGTINNMIRNQFEFNAIRYVGSLVKDSRPQCERWVGMGIIPITELDAEIAWAEGNGSGMIPGTTAENFEVYRGGYNCRHDAIPYYEPELDT